MAAIKIRRANIADIATYEQLQAVRWRDENTASHENLITRFHTYPQGMLVAEENNEIVGMVFAMRIASYDEEHPLSWYKTTHNGACDNHVSDGNIIFGVDLTTAPGVGARAGEKLLLGIGRLAIKENIELCMLGGRMPGYYKYKDKLSAEEYMWSKNSQGQFLDKQVRFYAGVPGLRVIKAIPHYFDDPDSDNYGVLLRWRNPFHGWPLPHFWSFLFPLLFKFEEMYLTLHSKLKHR